MRDRPKVTVTGLPPRSREYCEAGRLPAGLSPLIKGDIILSVGAYQIADLASGVGWLSGALHDHADRREHAARHRATALDRRLEFERQLAGSGSKSSADPWPRIRIQIWPWRCAWATAPPPMLAVKIRRPHKTMAHYPLDSLRFEDPTCAFGIEDGASEVMGLGSIARSRGSDCSQVEIPAPWSKLPSLCSFGSLLHGLCHPPQPAAVPVWRRSRNRRTGPSTSGSTSGWRSTSVPWSSATWRQSRQRTSNCTLATTSRYIVRLNGRDTANLHTASDIVQALCDVDDTGTVLALSTCSLRVPITSTTPTAAQRRASASTRGRHGYGRQRLRQCMRKHRTRTAVRVHVPMMGCTCRHVIDIMHTE